MAGNDGAAAVASGAPLSSNSSHGSFTSSWASTATGIMAANAKDAPANLIATTIIALSVLTLLSYVHHRRSTYAADALPKAWRATPSSPLAKHDSPFRFFVKTCVTAALLAVLPMQVAVVGSSIVLQTLLYYAGFGGGRPGTPAFPAVPVDSPAWNPLGRVFFWVRDGLANLAARYLLNDARNAPFLPWMFYLTFVTPSLFAAAAYHHVTVGQFQSFWYRLAAVFAYRILMMGPYFKFFAHGATLIHKEGHANKMRSGLFKTPLGPVLNHVMEWWVAFFYGHVPENYRVGHVEVHHGEGNDHGDVTSTLAVDRAEDGSFLMYLADFAEFWSNWAVVEWCDAKIASAATDAAASKGGKGGGKALATHKALAKVYSDRRAALSGMVAYYGAALALYLTLGPWFAFMYYLEPHLEVVNYLTAINYTWHTFADPDDHTNEYVKSITILDGHYLVFGEDYHVEHHLRPGVHWTKMADEYEKRKESYKKNRATVFADTMEFELFMIILLGDHDALAERFVDLSGEFPTHEDKKRELLRRMRAVPIERPSEGGKEGGGVRDGWSTNTRASSD